MDAFTDFKGKREEKSLTLIKTEVFCVSSCQIITSVQDGNKQNQSIGKHLLGVFPQLTAGEQVSTCPVSSLMFPQIQSSWVQLYKRWQMLISFSFWITITFIIASANVIEIFILFLLFLPVPFIWLVGVFYLSFFLLLVKPKKKQSDTLKH